MRRSLAGHGAVPRRRYRRTVALVAAALTLTAGTLTAGTVSTGATAATSPPWMDTSLDPDQRAALVLAQMSLEEKVELMTGNQGAAPSAFYNGPIERLGIPELRMADAGGGIAARGWTLPGTADTATAFPAGVNLGATWDPAVARRYAAAVGVEARATGHAMLLGPGTDIGRQPFWGRVGEGLSEDPELTAALTTPFVREVQRRKVIVNLKHYAGYTEETNRGSGQNTLIDERTLKEVYTLPYADAVAKARLASVMCSFNKINDVYSCENEVTLEQVLRQQDGFTGFVITDFGAAHSTVPSVTAGLDMETGTAAFYGNALLTAVQNGTVPEALLDRAVLRILRSMFAIGVFDTDYSPTAIPVQQGGRVARHVQDEAITLLKNSRHHLPLPRSVRSLAVIGADANVTARLGGSFTVKPTYEVSLLDALQRRATATGAQVTYARGNDPVNAANMIETADLTAVPSSVLAPEGGSGAGLTARHYANTTFDGTPLTRVEGQVLYDTGFTGGPPAFANLYASQVPPVPALTPNPFAGGQSVVYAGTLTAPVTGPYRLGLTGWGDARLFIDGSLVVDMTGQAGRRAVDAVVPMTAGQAYEVRIEYAATHPLVPLQPGTLVFQWAPPAGASSPDVQAAVQAAKASDVAVVYVRTYETEERDRVSLKLPQSADLLISEVVRANPRTVVVLATAGPVTMPWLGSVTSVLQNYMGGQEEGTSLTNVLFGDVNPSGHLPMSYPRSEQDLPPGVGNPWDDIADPTITYGDGLDVGYRGYLASGTAPLFPFGHGLSYTRFSYGKLVTTDLRAGGPKDTAKVKVSLRNTGKRSGSEVVQVYLGRLPGTDGPVRKLAGFAKVDLRAGTQANVWISLDRRSFSYWDAATDRWVTPKGRVPVYVGSSATDIALVGSIRVL